MKTVFVIFLFYYECRYAQFALFISVIELPRIPAYYPKKKYFPQK